jgi:hypothetical protein
MVLICCEGRQPSHDGSATHGRCVERLFLTTARDDEGKNELQLAEEKRKNFRFTCRAS